ncbi:MAG TPA: glycosyltransferase family 2 protein [Patescibacteria group bacterium]|nr:glycosyltransferase family 2 protein [Patescibacteria group bacterium]
MKILCVIPAYNEEKNISKTVESAKKYINDILVINDGSKDKTKELAKEAGAKVLSHIINRGQGAGLETGNEYARRHNYDIVVHFDADGQFLAEEIPDILKPIIEDGYPMSFGSRFLNKKTKMPWFKKHIIMRLAKAMNYIFLGIKTTDPQSGFRAMDKEALKKIKIENDGMAHCSEILAKTHKYGLIFKEVPITVIYNEFGQSLGSGFKTVKDLLINKINK